MGRGGVGGGGGGKRQNEKGERQRECAPLWEVETYHFLALSVYFLADGAGGRSVTVHVDSRASLHT
jgi:hypothetical protein